MVEPTTSPSTTGRVHWQISPGWEGLLIGPQGLRLDEWLQTGQAQVVKDGAHRTVYRVDLPERTLFLKHNRCRHWTTVVGHLLRASSSRREWQKTRELERRHIPTAAPVAVGEQRRGLVLDNYFVSEGIPGAQSLEDYAIGTLPTLDASLRCKRRSALLAAVARLAAAAHLSGVFHTDLHAGNILIADAESTAEPEPRLYLIDLPNVQFSGPLGWPRSRDSLVMLASGWLNRLSRVDRWRFWKAYLAARPDLQLDVREAAAETERCTLEYARRILHRRDKRAVNTNRDFYKIERRGGVAHAVTSLAADELKALMDDPQRLLRRHRHEPVKLSHSSVVVEAELPVAGAPTRVAYKRLRVKTWWKRLLGVFRSGRAVSSWRMGHALLTRGIATARPLAVFQPPKSLRRQESYSITAWIPGAKNLHLYLWELAGRSPVQRRRRTHQCAESLGRLLGRMHAWHVSHDDLKACNLVAVDRAEGVDTFLIDLDGVKILRRLSADRRARDLARLAASIDMHGWLSRTVRLRFLRAYLAELGDRNVEWKRTWRDTAAHADSIVRRFHRVGKPLA